MLNYKRLIKYGLCLRLYTEKQNDRIAFQIGAFSREFSFGSEVGTHSDDWLTRMLF